MSESNFNAFTSVIDEKHRDYIYTLKTEVNNAFNYLKDNIKSIQINSMEIDFDSEYDDQGGSHVILNRLFIICSLDSMNNLLKNKGLTFTEMTNVTTHDDGYCCIHFDSSYLEYEDDDINLIFSNEDFELLFDFRENILNNYLSDLENHSIESLPIDL